MKSPPAQRPEPDRAETPDPDRRHALRFLGSALIGTSAVSLLPACSSLSAASSPAGRAALLLPLTGEAAALGQTMAEASNLALGSDKESLALDILDTNDGGAAKAAGTALSGGASLILGPVFSADAAAAAQAIAGRAPLVAFSNDMSVTGPDTFVMGITPAQTVPAILQYARQRGIRRAAMVAGDDAWGDQSAAAAKDAAPRLDLTFTATVRRTALTPETALAQITDAGGGQAPDAILIADGDGRDALTRALADTGVQLLGTVQWSGDSGAGAPSGAWFAAPETARFGPFARGYREKTGVTPGLLAALAYDATAMARALALSGALTRAGLLRAQAFPGVAGDFRFTEAGACRRDMAIFQAAESGAQLIARVNLT